MPRLAVLALPLLLLAAPAQAADRKFDPDAAAKAVAPFLDDTVMVVGHLDLTRVDAAAIVDWAAKVGQAKPQEIAEPKKVLTNLAQGLSKAGVKDVYLVVGVGPTGGDFGVVVMPLEQGADEKAIAKVIGDAFPPMSGVGVEVFNKAAIVGPERDRKALKALKPSPRPELAKAFSSVGEGVARFAFIPSDKVRAQMEKEVPNLPDTLGGGPVKVIARGVQGAAVGIETPPKFKATFVVQATDKDSAKELLALAEKVVKLYVENKLFRDANPNADKLIPKFQPKIDAEKHRVTLTVDEEMLTALVVPAMIKVREAAARVATQNNMKQLGLAMHNYEAANGVLPAAANFDAKGKALLSWRVHMLPYLGPQEAALYKQFKLDEPWDSDNNKKLIAKMPEVFAHPASPKLAADGKTTFLVPVHKEAVFTGDKQGFRLTDITDGTTNTIMLVDAADDAAVIWTKPDDLKLDPKDPAKGLGVRWNGVHMFLFADGHVSMHQKTIDKKTLWGAFTRAGGEVIELP
jgi:prepilin-type processing-associated H-X9-DG protein